MSDLRWPDDLRLTNNMMGLSYCISATHICCTIERNVARNTVMPTRRVRTLWGLAMVKLHSHLERSTKWCSYVTLRSLHPESCSSELCLGGRDQAPFPMREELEECSDEPCSAYGTVPGTSICLQGTHSFCTQVWLMQLLLSKWSCSYFIHLPRCVLAVLLQILLLNLALKLLEFHRY